MSTRLTVVCAAKLHANQLERHLELFEHVPEVERVIVVRHAPVSNRLSKVVNRTVRAPNRLSHAVGLIEEVHRIVRSEKANLVVGFNPVPWGSFASWAAHGSGVPVCLSLIGMDYLQIQRWWGYPFLRTIRAAQAITVTGKRMAVGLGELGVDPARVRILPHSVDTRRFAPTEGEKAWDVVAIGQLVQRKRMDVLIEAVSVLAQRGRRIRLAILGKGPLESTLEGLARDLGVRDLVTFLGYRDDVESVLAQAKTFCLASEWEGVPFALMEAMAAGVVPVVTDVGTVSDWVRDEENGLLIQSGSVPSLVDAWERLFGEQLLQATRQRLIAERERLSLARGAAVWRPILGLPD